MAVNQGLPVLVKVECIKLFSYNKCLVTNEESATSWRGQWSKEFGDSNSSYWPKSQWQHGWLYK